VFYWEHPQVSRKYPGSQVANNALMARDGVDATVPYFYIARFNVDLEYHRIKDLEGLQAAQKYAETAYGSVSFAVGPTGPTFGGEPLTEERAQQFLSTVGPAPQRPGEPPMTVQPGSARTDIRGGEPLRDLATQLLARARELYQTDRLAWDGWARVYREVTGETPPAPEDRSLRRATDGSVAIAGATRYDLATWARAAGIELGPLAGGLSMAEIAARVKALAREAGFERATWDQWNWFYREVTGADAPAPEDRGFQRTSTGAVLIGGVETYPYETWAAHALGQITTVVDDGRGEPPPPPPPGRSMLGWLVLGGVLLLVVLRR
jgi:hypothetical protein